MGNELIRGHLDPLVMAVLEQGPLHGYAIIDELRRRSRGEFDVPEGTVYSALHRLERLGYLPSRWDEGPDADAASTRSRARVAKH